MLTKKNRDTVLEKFELYAENFYLWNLNEDEAIDDTKLEWKETEEGSTAIKRVENLYKRRKELEEEIKNLEEEIKYLILEHTFANQEVHALMEKYIEEDKSEKIKLSTKSKESFEEYILRLVNTYNKRQLRKIFGKDNLYYEDEKLVILLEDKTVTIENNKVLVEKL